MRKCARQSSSICFADITHSLSTIGWSTEVNHVYHYAAVNQLLRTAAHLLCLLWFPLVEVLNCRVHHLVGFLSLFISCRSGEKLLKYQANHSCLIMSFKYFFRTAFLRKFFLLRFSYKHCNFSPVCLLVTMGRKPWQGLFMQPLCFKNQWYYQEKSNAGHS